MFTAATLRRRMERVRVLLETHDEAYLGELCRGERSTTGFSEPRPRRYQCGQCAGNGCERCEGGRVIVEQRDAYDEGEKGFWAGPEAKTMTDQQIERELRAIRQTELKRDGVIADIDFEISLQQAESRDKRGSYEELRFQLERVPRELADDSVAVLRWLALHMRELRIPRWAFEEELDTIEAEAVELAKQGLRISEIAKALSVPQRQVKTALRRARPAA